MTGTVEAVEAPAPPAARSRRVAPACVCIALYVLLALITNYPAWLHGPGSWMACGGCGDPGQQVWFLQWGAFSVTHLHDPLRTNWVNYPWGADLATLTSMPLVGILTTPVTLLFGPVATWNLMNVVAFASSATAAMFAFRRWVSSWPAAFVGGLLYGFSPFMVAEGLGHLFLILNFVPPLLLLLLHDVLIRRSWSWKRSGVLLAVLVVVQLGISEELLAEEALVTVIAVLVVWAARPAQLRAGWAHIWRSLGLGIGLALPFIALMLVVSLTGPEHARGAAHPVSLLAGLSSNLLSPLIPTETQHFGFGAATYGSNLVGLTVHGKLVGPDPAEAGSYIGIPLLLLLLIGSWRLRRQAVVRFACLMALISFLVSMGSRLRVGEHSTGVPLPFALLTHLPMLKSEAASRYAICTWVFLALLAAVVVDRCLFAGRPLAGTPRQAASPSWWRRHELRRVGGAILLALGLFALVPQWPYPIAADGVPAWFSSSEVKQVPRGSPLITYPYATFSHNLPMLWQAVNGMRYRIPLGEAAVPDPHFTPFEVAFNLCWTKPSLRIPPAVLIPGTRVIFRYWQVHTVVVPLQYSVNPQCAIRFLTRTLHGPPHWQRGAAVWTLS
ncbi:MAG TPA: hypothetical protein VG405_01430 [Solirubrobacteraceae bacterium]|jgi:hypothetical protein|nr:hypothetical protein [Solirubrobacteraceae bacterium]